MAGPLRLWLNRKSKNGSRALSRVPRAHRAPWSTTPPIAKEDEMTIMDSPALNEMRRVLRGMVTVMTDGEDNEKASALLDQLDDAKLAAVAHEALTNFKRAKATYESAVEEFKNVRQQIEKIRRENDDAARTLETARKAIAERDDIAKKYQELQKEVDPDRRQLEIMYAVDKATESLRAEAAAMRRDLVQRQSEIESLKESKKRLREAMNRLADK